MELNNKDKLIITMLCDIHKALNIRNSLNPDFIQSAIYSDNLWALKFQYSHLLSQKESLPEYASDVMDILDMWTFIESAYTILSNEDKEKIKKEAAPFGEDVQFYGFDGNNETEHLSAAKLLINEMERFTNFSGRSLNSHYPSLESYKRMLKAFLPLRSKIDHRNQLSAKDIINILNARAA